MPPTADVWAFLPEIWVAALGLVLIVLTLVVPARRGNVIGWTAVAGLLLGLLPTFGLVDVVRLTGPRLAFFQSYAVDGFAVFFKVIALLTAVLVIIAAIDYFRSPGET